MWTTVVLFVTVIAGALLFFVFYIPCSHTRVRSNCPSTAKLSRLPLANIPPCKYTVYPSIIAFITWCWNYLHLSLFPGSKPEAKSYLSCFPSVWKSTSSRWTHWKTDGWMNGYWVARWMGQARKHTLALSLSLRRYPSKYLSKWVEILLAI